MEMKNIIVKIWNIIDIIRPFSTPYFTIIVLRPFFLSYILSGIVYIISKPAIQNVDATTIKYIISGG